MKRKLTSILLMSALLVGGASTFVSCKDYDGDQAAVTNAEFAKLKEIVGANYEYLAGLKGVVSADDLEKLGKIVGNAETIEQLVNANTAIQKVAANAEALAKLAGDQEALSKLAAMSSTWGDDFKNVVVKNDLLNYISKEEFPNWKYLQDLLAEKENMNNVVEDVIDSITAANAANYKTYAELVQAFDNVPSRLETVEKKLNQLLAWNENIQTTLDEMITGVNVDMIDNPYFGTLNTPFGIKSNMLIGFVGGEVKNQVFAGQKVGGLLTSEDGGSVYFTINPNDVNVEGLQFKLVGRDGSEAPGYALGANEIDNTKVTTRANVNGYKAVAGITDGKAAMVVVDKEQLKKVASNVLGALKREENLNIVETAKTIYKTFANAIPQYYALQATYNVWKTEDDATSPIGKKFVQEEKTYTSDYNIAAVTVKPLGYDTFAGKGFTIKSIPQLQEILGIDISDYQFSWEDLKPMDPMTASITVKIPDPSKVTIDGIPAPKVDIDKSKIETIKKTEIKEINGEEVEIVTDVDVNILEGFVKVGDLDLKNAVVTFEEKEETYTATVPMDDFNEMISTINNSVGGMLGNVNDLMDKLQSGMDKINNSVISRLNNVIAKVNKITENPNALLQPVLMYSDANGAGRMSEYDYAPTRFNLNGSSEGSIVLVATSYTLDMLSPAYIKNVTVKENGASIVKKGDRTYVMTAKPGKYTITYEAMDYYGATRTKTYYVEVK